LITLSSFRSQSNNDGFYTTCYLGDSAVLLAFNIDPSHLDNLAGFTVECTTPNKGPYQSNKYFLKNRIGFKEQPPGSTLLEGSDEAPFQSFHWVHFPSAGPGQYQYSCYAAFFNPDGTIRLGQNVTVTTDLSYRSYPKLEAGFTRGYISSQAYADRFTNKPIGPTPKSMDFDTTPYLGQYIWLGAHARQEIFEFLKECETDNSIALDVFSFDFDEPDIIRSLCKLGTRVRVFQDDSPEHTTATSLEPKTVTTLQASGIQVKLGHFSRFAHDKVMIQKDKNGIALKVLTGSANFSLRGMYVQANSVLVSSDQIIAAKYEEAFQQAWNNEQSFKSSTIASAWFGFPSSTESPQLSVSFAPHPSPPFSLDKVATAIQTAKSSVFFAVMQAEGGGPVIAALENLAGNQGVLSLGTIQSASQMKLFKQGLSDSVASFNYLGKTVPKPFEPETSGGIGQVIHHKFVVVDFNSSSPVVFCGSSNLSSGGEVDNGDNLIAISDQRIATMYAVEAIRLYDHYEFRSIEESSAAANTSIALQTTSEWSKPYFSAGQVKFTERQLLCPITD